MVTSRTIGPYTLEAPLGQGGMGETWLAVREAAGQFRRHCCVKILRSELRSEASALAQFRDEARIHALLHHDAIVQVYDFGEDEEGCYLVMEYVQGCDLRQLLARYHGRKQRIPMRLAVYIAAELLQALDYAHRACDHQGTPLKLVHRDISPANILLTATGRVKLTDFGISTFVDRTARTKTGFVVGKPGYFAPEQADPTATREGRLDARTDLFAVGVVMYEMFAGTAPFAKQAPADPQAPWDCKIGRASCRERV